MSDLEKCYTCETVYEDTIHICEPHKMSSGKAFPPRLLGRFHKFDNGESFYTAEEERRIYPAWMRKEYNFLYISNEEHSALIEAKDEELARLRAALEKCARANERIMKNGKWGPDFVLSRIDIKTFAEQALAGGKDE